MAWTQSDLDVINKAIASGKRRVKFADREVEYHSIDDLLRARSEIQADLARQGRKRVRIVRLFGRVT